MTEDSGLIKLELSVTPLTEVGYQWHGENASGKQILTCLWYLLRYRLVIA